MATIEIYRRHFTVSTGLLLVAAGVLARDALLTASARTYCNSVHDPCRSILRAPVKVTVKNFFLVRKEL